MADGRHNRKHLPDKERLLYEAALVGDVAEAEKWLAKGGNVNIQDSYGQSVLHYAVWKGHVSVAELFLGKMKKVDVEDNYKSTPLFYAIGHAATTQLLLNAGANVNHKDKTKKDALHYSKVHKKTEVITVLQNAMQALQQGAPEVPSLPEGDASTDTNAEPINPSEQIVEHILNFQEELGQEAFAFADQHFQDFEVMESGEHQLQNKQLHNQFTEIFELRLNDYLAAKEIAPQTFYNVLEEQTAADSKSTALLLQSLRIATDYDFFIEVMRERKDTLRK
jgi:hypothetical protein